MTDRCERTDLPVDGCAHCRPKVVDPVLDDVLELGPRFTAQFSGACGSCDGYIHAGETIAALVDGPGYACPACIEDQR
jgi:hypothetical protein